MDLPLAEPPADRVARGKYTVDPIEAGRGIVDDEH